MIDQGTTVLFGKHPEVENDVCKPGFCGRLSSAFSEISLVSSARLPKGQQKCAENHRFLDERTRNAMAPSFENRRARKGPKQTDDHIDGGQEAYLWETMLVARSP
jgi:hypothetical protein